MSKAIEVSEAAPAGSALAEYLADEDFGMGDIGEGGGLPRLKINQKNDEDPEDGSTTWQKAGTFGNSDVDGIYQTSLNIVLLGRVPQRQLWPKRDPGSDAPTGGSPMCQSFDGSLGFGTNRLHIGRTNLEVDNNGEGFTVNKKGFLDILDEEHTELACANCDLGKNGEELGGNWSPPECSNVDALIVLVDFFNSGVMTPAVWQVKGSGLGPARNYFREFKKLQQPPISVFTTVSLDKVAIDATDAFYKPRFSRGEPTSRDDWEEYVVALNGTRRMVSTPYFSQPPVAEIAEDAPTASTVPDDVDEDF